ncbi:MAG: phosphate ABC transporter ATP-binding protein [Firmicutes bacterium]|nr:phosphate ABC transporter ATP-binding protein [Bacillota bacterium]
MQGVSKIYDQEVLRVEHLTLTKGCIYGIIGPSGAGKSTLLRIINLLTRPDSGEVLYQGCPTPQNGPERLALQRKMSLVFQQTLLFKDSVWNNVAYGLKARGFPKAEIRERVNSLLEQVGLKKLASRGTDTLSGGEAQRVAIARAVAFEPELLLLDEPTANLDPGNIELIEEIITKLARQKKITVVMVTHNVFQARRIADQVIFINQGQIVESGATEQIFQNPQFDTTAAYISGRMVY